MERLRQLSGYQRVILLLLAIMTVLFGGIYAVVCAKEGYLYQDVILVPGIEDGNTVYTGTIEGQDARFTVTSDGKVLFLWGAKKYGPYTVLRDPSAVPKDDPFRAEMEGIEIRDGDQIRFRGGFMLLGGSDLYPRLIREDGTGDIAVTVTLNDGTILDGNGNVIDPMEPSNYAILELLQGPVLTHKGNWIVWFMGLVLAAITIHWVLYADDIFRWNLSFRIENAGQAVPSDLELGRRYIGWGALTLLTLVMYLIGLR